MSELKLIALDAEDLGVISAHLQDATFRVADITYQPSQKRFAGLANRFNWTTALQHADGNEPMTRHRCALRIEQVQTARTQGIDLSSKSDVLSLLAIQYEQLQNDDPGGHITLLFAGGGAIRLQVEYIEMELRDLGGAWATQSMPTHDDSDNSG